MKENKTNKVIRTVFTLALIYLVFEETGIFTALAMFLIFMAIENFPFIRK